MTFRSLVMLGSALLLSSLHAAGQQTVQKGPSGFTVTSAKRANVFIGFSQKLKATNETDDVVLVVEVGGMALEEFQKVDSERVYVLAGERKCLPHVTLTGVFNGKPGTIKLAMIVPRKDLALQLVIGDRPPLAFKAPAEVVAELR